MTRQYFYIDEEKLRARLLMLKELVAEQELHAQLCGRLKAIERAWGALLKTSSGHTKVGNMCC